MKENIADDDESELREKRTRIKAIMPPLLHVTHTQKPISIHVVYIVVVGLIRYLDLALSLCLKSLSI